MPEITIGPFTLDTASGRMLRDGAEIRLRPQALQALEVLLRNTGRPVSYEQMIAEAWKGTHVSKHTVDVTVGEVKKNAGRVRALDHTSAESRLSPRGAHLRRASSQRLALR
jgi:DNA-binding winged helix-turn-helix (wHTH) protein